MKNDRTSVFVNTQSNSPQSRKACSGELPDEDRFALSPTLLRRIYPRRGFPSGDKLRTVKSDSPEHLWSTVHHSWMQPTALPKPELEEDPALLQRVLGMLSSPAVPSEFDPKTFALAALVTEKLRDPKNETLPTALADYTVKAFGLSAAVRTAITCATFACRRGEFDHRLFLADDSDERNRYFAPTPFLARIRRWVVAASDLDYDAALSVADEMVPAQASGKLFRSFLFPNRRAWFVEATEGLQRLSKRDVPYVQKMVIDPCLRPLWLASVSQLDDLEKLAGGIEWDLAKAPLLGTLYEALGPSLLPSLIGALRDLPSARAKAIANAIALCPTDEAMETLLDRLDDKHVRGAIDKAVLRFPRRAVRLISRRVATQADPALVSLLGQVAASYPQLAEDVGSLDSHPENPASGTADTAPVDEWPEVLRSPPWTKKRKARKRRALELELIEECEVVWERGERWVWRASFRPEVPAGVDFDDWLRWLLNDTIGAGGVDPAVLLLRAPMKLARQVPPRCFGTNPESVRRFAKAAVARLEEALIPHLQVLLKAHPGLGVQVVRPIGASALAMNVAEAFVTTKGAQRGATAWLDRHPRMAALGLLPFALGRSNKQQRAATALLRVLASRHRGVVDEVAGRYGAEAVTAVEALLSTDPREELPRTMPKLPNFWFGAKLPAPVLEESGRPLPQEALEPLTLMLALSTPGEPYAGLADVQAACRADSLARFAFGLFEAWREAGMPNKERWVLAALGLLGDDQVARDLARYIRTWPGEGGHQRAVKGLDVLAAIGTDVALMHLFGIAQKLKFKGLRKQAHERILQIADERGLTEEELADRLVPDFGLDPDGTLTLDYGPRKFVVGFDEALKPVVTQDGKRRKTLPKPGAKDDPDLAPAAYARFRQLKKDVRIVAKQQLRRLEDAMVAERHWSPDEFRRFFLEHPLMVTLARRLVWFVETSDGTTVSFRVAEGSTLATLADDLFELPADARIGIAHPLTLGEDLARSWAGVFGDYAILQPFPQLSRETFRLEPEERAHTRLTRFEGQRVPTRNVRGLTGRGWYRAQVADAGLIEAFFKDLGAHGRAVLPLEPGIVAGVPDEYPEQKLGALCVASFVGDFVDPKTARPLGELPAVLLSELIRDLSTLLT